MNWRLPRRYTDHLPDTGDIAHYLDPRELEAYLPSRHQTRWYQPSHWFDRRPRNTDLTIAIGVGAAACLGLLAGAYLLSRDDVLSRESSRSGDGPRPGDSEDRSDTGD